MNLTLSYEFETNLERNIYPDTRSPLRIYFMLSFERNFVRSFIDSDLSIFSSLSVLVCISSWINGIDYIGKHKKFRLLTTAAENHMFVQTAE